MRDHVLFLEGQIEVLSFALAKVAHALPATDREALAREIRGYGAIHDVHMQTRNPDRDKGKEEMAELLAHDFERDS
jgi:hypothetical protein